jgi:amino acid permease-like protein
MTTMAGSSRTLYQGSLDGWLPRYLGKANQHGAPARAMWTDLCFNLVLLLMSDYVFVLAASTVCYMIFNFLNLNAGWLDRRDNPDVPRPWRAPTVLIGAGAVLAFVNALLLGWGANVWGQGALVTGLVFAALVIPVFAYRHYVQDKGRFPESMYDDTTPDMAVEVTDDGSADTTADTAVDSAAEVTADGAADVAADATDDGAADTAADTAVDSAAEVTADGAADVAADATDDGAADTTADTGADSAADTSPSVDGTADATVETSAESADTVADSAADTTTESAATSPGRKADLLPYLVLAGGALMVIIGQLLAS